MADFADSNLASLRYIPESISAWGVTPVAGVTREMRITSSGLAYKKNTTQSEELRADRMISTVVETSANTDGEVNFEYSAGSQDDFLQAFVLGGWTRVMTFDKFSGSTLAWNDNNTLAIKGVDVSDYFTVGRRIKTEGFTKPENNGYRQISAVSYSAPDTLLDFSTSTAVAEAGNGFSRLYDANDVIIFNNTALRFGTAGAKTIDSNGGNAFSAAISAGQLVSGQKIFVEFSGGFETGTFAFARAAGVGDAVSIDDGENEVLTFTFGSASDEVAPGAANTNSATNLAAAINLAYVQGKINCTATASSSTVTVRNLNEAGLGTLAEVLDQEQGLIVWTTVSEDADAFTINDGVSGVITFTFGTDPGEILVGATATDSATNAAAAIVASALNVTVYQSTTTLRIVNHEGTSGAIVETVDADTNFAVTDFAAIITTVDFTGGVAGVRGFYTLVSAANDVLTVVEPITTAANGGSAAGHIKGSMLRNPGNPDDLVRQSFSIQTGFFDVDQFMLHDGLRVGSFNLTIAAEEIVKGTMNFMGKETSAFQVDVLGDVSDYTVLTSTSTEPFNATENVGSLTKNGLELTTAMKSISLTMEANLRNQNAVGSKFPRGIGTGRFNLTGSVEAYFENLDMWNDMKEHNTISLGFSFTDVDGNTVFWTLPALKIGNDPVAPGGIDQDVMEKIEFMAFRDPTTECMLQLDRFSSTAAY